jgi:hypothetical protein
MTKKARNPDLVWQELNPDTLQPESAKAYRAYKAKYAEAKSLKDAFEACMVKAAELPATHTLRFGYNFGKLSVAVDKATVASSASKKAISFADLIKAA